MKKLSILIVLSTVLSGYVVSYQGTFTSPISPPPEITPAITITATITPTATVVATPTVTVTPRPTPTYIVRGTWVVPKPTTTYIIRSTAVPHRRPVKRPVPPRGL